VNPLPSPPQTSFSHPSIELEATFNKRLFLEGPAGAGKTSWAVERLLSLLSNGIPGGSILVFAPQRTLLWPYEQALRSPQAHTGGSPTLLTVGGLAQRIVNLFWPLAVQAGGFAFPDQPPVFLTLETAQYIMARVVQPLIEDQRLFDSLTMDRNRLYSQLLDNLNKAAVVGFPPAEIGTRLKDSWIGDPVQLHIYEDVQTCCDAYRSYCLAQNLLDFSLQIELFRSVLWPLPACRGYLHATYRHLIVENIEEDTPVTHDLIEAWLPDVDSAVILFDRQAGYRRFLGADPLSARRLQALCDQTVVFPVSHVQSEAVSGLEQRLSARLPRPAEPHFLFSDEPTPVAAPEPASGQVPSLNLNYSRFYPEMLDWVAETIAGLIADQGVPPGEIVVLSPYLSDALRFALVERLNVLSIPARSHRPSRSLREEPATECLLTLAALAHPAWGMRPSRFDVAYSLVQAIEGLDLVRAQLLAEIVYHPKGEGRWLSSFDKIRPEVQQRITYSLGERYEKLQLWLQAAQDSGQELDHFLRSLFGEILSQPGFGFHTQYDSSQVAANLIESIQKFRWVAGPTLMEQGIPLGKEYLLMVQQGVIAAQYLGNWRAQSAAGSGTVDQAVLLAPAYTFLMANRPVAYQFWLDAGSRGWIERLNQPLTHPYVLSRGWPRARPWTDADEVAAGTEALHRLVIGLLRRCRSGLYLGLSELNEQGFEQRGPLLTALQRLLREGQAYQKAGAG